MKFQHFYRICLITAGTLILYGCMDSGEKSFSKELDKAMDVGTDSLDLRKYPKIDTHPVTNRNSIFFGGAKWTRCILHSRYTLLNLHEYGNKIC